MSAMRFYDVTSLAEVVYQSRHGDEAQIAVVIPLYNYAGTVLEAQDNTLARVDFYVAKARFYERLRGKLNEVEHHLLSAG